MKTGIKYVYNKIITTESISLLRTPWTCLL